METDLNYLVRNSKPFNGYNGMKTLFHHSVPICVWDKCTEKRRMRNQNERVHMFCLSLQSTSQLWLTSQKKKDLKKLQTLACLWKTKRLLLAVRQNSKLWVPVILCKTANKTLLNPSSEIHAENWVAKSKVRM